MMMPIQTAILWPTIALVAVVYGVWITLFVRRFSHMKRNPPQKEDFVTGAAAMRYFEPVEMPANNLRNIFEMPVLYFALIPLVILTGHATTAQVALAWIYVAARAAHSVVHASGGPVLRRFFVYLASCVVLSAMWIGFAIDLLR
jgi:hypothetical protein